ncbi:GNAT family N-acetyltransferase [Salinarimonas sp.]|uniref:GNAT family N-acetyltransferase n=1 Tax=Salinarimonas sp. TaxID=2766526 RepID=UPI0032D92B96
MPRLRPATRADLPRIHAVRHGVSENRLLDPNVAPEAEVLWYMDEAIFLVAEDEAGEIQGFACADARNGYVWALFVIEDAHGSGFGTALHDAVLARFAEAGLRQAWLTTGDGTSAMRFYERRGWRVTGRSFRGDMVMVRAVEPPSP